MGTRSAQPYALRAGLWLASGVAGAIAFWLVQVMAGGPTIPEFVGQQIASAGGYPAAFAPAIGWAVHLGVSLSYALLFAAIGVMMTPVPFRSRVVITLIVALALAGVTTMIAPPAISVTISLLGRRQWPDALFPVNTELGLPFWNHVGFFLLSWLIQIVGLRLLQRRSVQRAAVAP